jgi:hypothetical protein
LLTDSDTCIYAKILSTSSLDNIINTKSLL